MFGSVVDDFARLAGVVRPRRLRASSESPLRINVGSGLIVAPGWLHLDGSIHALMAKAPAALLRACYRFSNSVHWLDESEYLRRLRDHEFVHTDLERGIPLRDATVDVIFSSHVLEHLFLDRARKLASEMYRVAKPGALVRIGVPDLRHAVTLYESGARRAALEFFFTESKAPYFRQHRYMYDFELLAELLQAEGFKDVTRCAYRQGRCPDLELLDAYPDETLFVEASK